jgi:endonuclease YncB( thermonuclease family)
VSLNQPASFVPLAGYWLLAIVIAFHRRPCWILLTVSALILLAGPPAKAASCPRGSLTAVVTQVWGGDTIKVGTVPIRLQGLAAPVATEQGHERASVAMAKLVLGREVRCEVEDEHGQGDCVGVCYLDGQDIAMTMVRQGLARDCPGASDRRYADAEYQAAVDGATIGWTYRLPVYCNRM